MRLRLTSIAHSFGARQLFDGLDLNAQSGESIGLMGPSGAGKSTLLSIIAREIVPAEGTVVWSSSSLHAAWVLQSTPLLARRTALSNVMLGPLSRGMEVSSAASQATRAMRQLNVWHTASQKVFQLSGGERQRVAVARAMASRADILLADEPTASLDPVSRSAVVESLRAAAGSGALVIVCTHDLEVARSCDRAYSLHGGQLRPLRGALDEVLQ